jgi:hypothetical protein
MTDQQTTLDFQQPAREAEPVHIAPEVLRLRTALRFYADRASYNATDGGRDRLIGISAVAQRRPSVFPRTRSGDSMPDDQTAGCTEGRLK